MDRKIILLILLVSIFNAGCSGFDFSNQKQSIEYMVVKTDGFSKIVLEEGVMVEPNTILAEWDAYTIPIVSEVGGIVKFGDIIEGSTMQEKVDGLIIPQTL